MKIERPGFTSISMLRRFRLLYWCLSLFGSVGSKRTFGSITEAQADIIIILQVSIYERARQDK